MESHTPSPQGSSLAAEKQEMPPLKEGIGSPMSVTEMVNRLEELVLYTLEYENKQLREDVSFVDVYKQLTEIRKSLELLSADQQKFLTLLNELESRRSGTSATAKDADEVLTDEDRKVIEKLNRLKTVCEKAKERVHASLVQQPEEAALVQEKISSASLSEKKKMIHRKGKFRQMGGGQGWVRT